MELVTFSAFCDRNALVNAAFETVIDLLSEDIQRIGMASMVGAGGSTPGPLYRQLAKHEFDWENVAICPSDAVCLPLLFKDRFPHIVESALLQDAASEARFIPLYDPNLSVQDSMDRSNRAVNDLPNPFSVTLLGMGADFHVASLYPSAFGLGDALNLADSRMVRPVAPVTLKELPFLRLTLTLRALLHSKKIILLITGDEKREAFEHAQTSLDALACPASAILQQDHTPVDVFWSA